MMRDERTIASMYIDPPRGACPICGGLGHVLESIDNRRADVAVPCYACHEYCRTCKQTVIINWTASTTPGVSYNVYRATVACASASTGTKPNSSPITALTYTDSNVTAGTYCYWATSYLQSAATQESAPSNKADVSIIEQPAPPTNLPISPPAVTMQTGSQQQFTASIPDAVWSIEPADMGSITTTGLYTAPSKIQGNNVTVQVIARSGMQSAVAAVTIRKN